MKFLFSVLFCTFALQSFAAERELAMTDKDGWAVTVLESEVFKALLASFSKENLKTDSMQTIGKALIFKNPQIKIGEFWYPFNGYEGVSTDPTINVCAAFGYQFVSTTTRANTGKEYPIMVNSKGIYTGVGEHKHYAVSEMVCTP